MDSLAFGLRSISRKGKERRRRPEARQKQTTEAPEAPTRRHQSRFSPQRIEIQRSVMRTAKLTIREAERDIFRVNPTQNTLMNTTKGVIHGIAERKTDQDIHDNLVGTRNPTILQAIRMGPMEVQCHLYRKKIEVCGLCGKVGHRTDVRPQPEERRCKDCGILKPPDEHACTPACGICGKAHPTVDRQCKQRLKTPFPVTVKEPEQSTAVPVGFAYKTAAIELQKEEPKATGNLDRDVTFVRNVRNVKWCPTMEDLGSDDYVIQTEIKAEPGKPKATEVILEEAKVEAADSRLSHLWEANSRMQKRLGTQKRKRHLRRRIAKLSREIETHTDNVTNQRLQGTLDGFDSQPNVPRTWNILRHLLGPEGSKTAQRKKLSEFIGRHEVGADDLVEEIRRRCIGDSPPRIPTWYTL
ncbi:hypothetical protein HPB47_013870 [Ixodes persulcatus]|uniref:Uncharacterized protein n=1 Tax=Ixodes persulcatus TaxID=34615 RepID=A0AC60R013_IXOPE|nr:hypothetical protein HPB47_013870 [Ixodes persulcatus]